MSDNVIPFGRSGPATPPPADLRGNKIAETLKALADDAATGGIVAFGIVVFRPTGAYTLRWATANNLELLGGVRLLGDAITDMIE